MNEIATIRLLSPLTFEVEGVEPPGLQDVEMDGGDGSGGDDDDGEEENEVEDFQEKVASYLGRGNM